MDQKPPVGFTLAEVGRGYGQAFGPLWVDRSGHRIGFYVGERHVNPTGTCHGGALATFSDTQLIAHRRGSEAGESHCPTISLSVDYFVPAPLGAWVEAAVIVVKQTRTMMFTQAVLTIDAEPIARSSVIYRIRENERKET